MTSPLPPALQHLPELIYNLWWTWHQDVWPLFARLDGETWEKTHNPCAALATARPDHLASLANDATYGALLEQSWQRLQNYLHTRQTWLHQQAADEGWLKDHPIAYFSAEYGIHECLPIYSGGLGILSGDHVKSSSDLGIPMVFIGLYYHEGYFRQEIDGAGKQVDQYPVFHPRALPLTLIEKDHAPLKIKVRLSGQEVYAQVWEAKVGINRLLLLDSKLPENSPAAQTITDRLYGGDREMRISQEILLGIGGIRVLKSLGINPCAYHMNEGHAGFFQLERIRDMMHDEHLSFKQAALACAANCIFTTHTPVPAGNEAFRLPVMHKYFYDFIKELKITWNDFLSLGMADDQEGNKYFGLTIFAIRLSRFQNGVSKLHGKVAQRMWRHLWPKVSESENPITSITNGVHVQTWMAPAMKALCQKGLGDNWIEQLDGPTLGQQIENFSDDAWALCRQSLKQEMIAQVRTYLARQYTRQGKTEMAQAAQNFLREN
ncbi:MAG: alpha-glucan family phosphorylase, partial [Bacteriovoracaceae bacterium]|nr:alpha-glucan family phosphorylase [Bacteriovoracaceae bacterium]